MSVFKCKMCGGTIEFEPGATVGVCDSCGTTQTLPRLDDDRKANLYDRANHFRRSNDFDKAEAIYEQILNEDTTDAEAYWSLVLCRYGIEYVEDPSSHKRVPTVNRTQFTSIFDDDNYKSAIYYADSYQREIYESEAKTINDIQKGILAISQKEEPFDVFICYKETDNNGRRTPDSVLANDLYHQLTQEGFKVFFARITLEDKLGSAYEPYIFAALNSAKVMVVLGTKPEYFKAVWVKNEWSRYLSLVKQSNGKKVLIPAYRDMDPYDLPDEFSHLQAQDMSKLGFMQDLIRGIKKLTQTDEPKVSAVSSSSNSSTIVPLLKRAFLFLEDRNWDEADDYFEKVLDLDPENAEAYLGKLMVELNVTKKEELKDCAQPFDSSNNYAKAIRFADSKLQGELERYNYHIKERNENQRLTNIYNTAVTSMNSAKSESSYKYAADILKTIPGFKDADTLREQCLEKAEICRKDAIYSSGKASMNKNTIGGYNKAIQYFNQIANWRDSDEQIYICKNKINEIEAYNKEQERIAKSKAKKRKIVLSIVSAMICLSIVFVFVFIKFINPSMQYNKAHNLIVEGNYYEAYTILTNLSDFKDSKELSETIYQSAELQKIYYSQVGDIVCFGSYEQDNNFDNGKEEIEWIVLDKIDDKALLLSKYILDYQSLQGTKYDFKKASWEDSTLKEWLNGIFYDESFSQDNKSIILDYYMDNDGKFTYDESVVNVSDGETVNKVFILSSEELSDYSLNDDLKAKGTKYFSSIYYFNNNKTKVFYEWWLRSNYIGNFSTFVKENGIIGEQLNSYIQRGIRPAIWVKIQKYY